MDAQQSNRAHRSNSKRNTAKQKLHSQGNNVKAFAFAKPGKLQRQAGRTSDLSEKKLHVPMVDRSYQLGEQLTTDVFGPINGKYGLVMKDKYSQYCLGRILNSRKEVSQKSIEMLKVFKNLLRLQGGSTII